METLPRQKQNDETLTRSEFPVTPSNVLTDRGRKIRLKRVRCPVLADGETEGTAHEKVCMGPPLLRDTSYGRRLTKSIPIHNRPRRSKRTFTFGRTKATKRTSSKTIEKAFRRNALTRFRRFFYLISPEAFAASAARISLRS